MNSTPTPRLVLFGAATLSVMIVLLFAWGLGKEGSGLAWGFLLFGSVLVVFHRPIGRFEREEGVGSKVAGSFWRQLRVRDVQNFYLLIGMAFVVGGIVLLTLGTG